MAWRGQERGGLVFPLLEEVARVKVEKGLGEQLTWAQQGGTMSLGRYRSQRSSLCEGTGFTFILPPLPSEYV